MKKLRILAALPLFTAACCAPVPDPAPTPAPVSTATPASPALPPAISQPVHDNWLDAPQTPGNWNYRDGRGLSFATFGEAGQAARFGIECAKSTRTIRLVRGSSSPRESAMRIRTETADRLFTAAPSPDNRPMLIATVPGSDRFLDKIALSRGRFAVETAGMTTIYVPAWPEITRVIEDCR